MLKRETWKKLTGRDVRFAVRRHTNLAAVTVNPYSPEGWQFDPVFFIEKMKASVSVPVFDVISYGENCR